ncbi:CHASE3 domain-containing protein [Sphingomonas sp. LR60]|uniref:CHASE3 domain-containing protein n=1 Tax=Sphingomonas sp. LR60 TaxID=3050233 RepID=UPI002FDF85BF
MFTSLISRVTAIGGLIATALLCLVAVLLQSSWSTRESFAWVSHSQQVIVVLDEALEELREAESGQRGYLLTHDERFATTVDQRLSDVSRQLDQLVRLTSDNALQNERAIAVRDAGSRKVAFTRESMRLARRGDFAVAVRGIAGGGDAN